MFFIPEVIQNVLSFILSFPIHTKEILIIFAFVENLMKRKKNTRMIRQINFKNLFEKTI